MSSIIRLLVRLAAATTMCYCGLASAFSGDLFSINGCHRFACGAEFLYLRPSHGDLLYAVTDARGSDILLASGFQARPVGPKNEIEPHYHPGFRVWLGWISLASCADFVGAYTRLHTGDSGRAVPLATGALWTTFQQINNTTILFNPGVASRPGQLPACARARASFDYDAGDLEVGIRACHSSGLWTRGFVGIHAFNLYHQLSAVYVGTSNPGNNANAVILHPKRSSQVWALGPEIGVEANYNAWCGLGLAGNFIVGMTAGAIQNKSLQRVNIRNLPGTSIIDQTMNVSSQHNATVIPFMGSRLGVSYVGNCWNLALKGEFGYEFRTYFGPIRNTVYTGDRATSSKVAGNFSYDGFYLSLMVEI